VLVFAGAISLACSFLFGLAPAMQVSKLDLNDVLKEGARGSTGPRRRIFRNVLVVAETALALMLLVGSGLLLESFARLRGLDPGFRADHVLTVHMDVPPTKYSDFNRRSQFFADVLTRVRALPGVKTAGFTSALPLTWDGGTNSFIPEHIAPRPEVTWDANDRVVTPGYFEAMRIPLRRGRLFRDSDGPNAPPVAIINETMARKFWPGEDPIGKRFKLDADGAPWREIVGVVADVRQMRLAQPPRQEMYFPYWQAKDNWMVPHDLVIHASETDPSLLWSAVRQAVWSVDRDQPLSGMRTLDELLDREVAARRVQTTLLGGFAALALMLACVGIYGVLSYAVTQRTPEIGIRVALGASATDVFRTVSGQGMRLVGMGIVAGLAATLALSRVLSSLLFDIKATDPVTYAGAIVVFAIVALMACYFPARRAARVDAMVALRYE
jgi:putative ABC transport system permease protein